MGNLKEINCKEIFKKAYENRYTWKDEFNGYKGKCIFSVNNNIYEGEFLLGKDFKPNIQKIEDEKIVKSIASQLFEVCIHRVKREFNSIHSENSFNLIKNSIESLHQKFEKDPNFIKKISIEILQNNDHIKFILVDNGIGFNQIKGKIKNILNPYFTTKKNGTGLGLSIVSKIINDHNGKIEFIALDEGAKIKIEFIK